MEHFLWIGVGAVAGVGLVPWTGGSTAVGLAIGLAAIGVALLLRRDGLALHVALGLSLGLIAFAAQPTGLRLRGPVAAVGVVIASPTGREADVVVSRWAPLRGLWRPAEGRVRVRFPADFGVEPGGTYLFFGDARPVEGSGPPGAPDPVRAAARSKLRTIIMADAARALGGDPRPDTNPVDPLLVAIATGDRDGLPARTVDLLRDTGTAHLLAVSGSNVGLAAVAAAWIAQRLLGLIALARPRGGAAWLPPVVAVVASAAFTIGVGAPLSAQRALIVIFIAAVGRATGRVVDMRGLLGLAALVLALADPACVGSPSFHLSFGAVAGLALWAPTLESWIPASAPWPVAAVAKALAVSVAATIGTLPATAWWFQSFPPLGPVANLAAVPWTGVVLMPAALLAMHGPAPIAGLANTVGVAGGELMLRFLELTRVTPWHPAVGPVGALLLCGLYGLASRPWVTCVLTTAVLSWTPRAPDVTRVVFPDVGQGSCALVLYPDGRRWLVDGGLRSAGVAAWLRREHVDHLDVVVASHGDLDHVGGLPDVLDTITVDALWVGDRDGLDDVLAAAARRGVAVVDAMPERVYPQGPIDPALDRNDRSQVVVVEGQVVLPGDISARVERTITTLVPDARVLALSHHGSATGSSDVFLAATHPELAIAQVGRRNRYGHPNGKVLHRLQDDGIPVLRSDVHGTVTIDLTDPLRVTGERAGVGRYPITPWSTEAVRAPITPPSPSPSTASATALAP